MYQIHNLENITYINFKGKSSYNLFNKDIFDNFKSDLETFLNSDSKGLIFSLDESSLVDKSSLHSFLKNCSNFSFIEEFREILIELEESNKPVVSVISDNITGILVDFIMISDVVYNNDYKVCYDYLDQHLLFGGAIQRLMRLKGLEFCTHFFMNFNEFNDTKKSSDAIVDAKLFINEYQKDNRNKYNKKVNIQSPIGYQFFPIICARLIEKKLDQNLNYKSLLNCIYQGGQLEFKKAIKIDSEHFLHSLG